jgi:hypothetical protein
MSSGGPAGSELRRRLCGYAEATNSGASIAAPVEIGVPQYGGKIAET